MTKPADEETLALDWACDRISAELKIKRQQLCAAHVFSVPESTFDNECGVEIPLSHKISKKSWLLADEHFHHVIYNRLIHNLSMVLFEKGIISTDAVHAVTFKAKQCLTEKRLLSYKDFVRRKNRFPSLVKHIPSILKKIWKRHRKLIHDAPQDGMAVLSDFRTMLKILTVLMSDTSEVPSIEFCRVRMYPKAFREWILTHLKSEIARMEDHGVHAENRFSTLQSTRQSEAKIFNKMSSRMTIEVIQELVQGGLIDAAAGERLTDGLRSREVEWAH